MPSLVRHLRALVIAIAVLALSATVVLGARGLPSLAAALTGSGTTADATGADDQGEDTDAPDEDAPETDAPETDAPETDAPETDAPETDSPGTAEAGDQADNHGAMVSQAAGMQTPAGFANHGAFVSCVARQNHGHLAPGATPIPLDQLTPADCTKDASGDSATGDATTPDVAPTSEKLNGKSANAHDKAPKSHGHGHGKGHGH